MEGKERQHADDPDAVVAALDIRVYRARSATTLAVRGELDVATGPALEAHLRQRDDEGREVVVDLSELQFIDATGLRVLLRASLRATAGGCRVRVGRTSAPVDRLIALTGTAGPLGLPVPLPRAR